MANCHSNKKIIPLGGLVSWIGVSIIVVALLHPVSSSGAHYGHHFTSRALERKRAIQSSMTHINAAKIYRIGVKNMPPMCFYDPTLPQSERYSGFYIDFWRQMNDELGLNYTFRIYDNNVQVLDAIKKNEIDIGLGLSITWKRAMEVDFTQPIVDGSLRIMTKYGSNLNLWEMFMPFHWLLWLMILLVAVVNAHVIWLVERDTNTNYFPKFYFSGVREGLWFSCMNLMMMDDGVVRSFPGKMLKFGSTFIGVILISSYTANLASFLTTGDANTKIFGPQDLIGSKVGATYGSTAADYIASYGGMQLALFPSSVDAFNALRDGKIPAIILDYPVLVYYSRIYDIPGVSIIENILEYDQIGLAMSQNSSLILTLNGVIVSLTQSGLSKTLSDKWIGQPRRSVTSSYYVSDTAGMWIWMLFWIVAALVTFLLKKYLVRKSYKHTSWYATLGGDEGSSDDNAAGGGPLLTKQKAVEKELQGEDLPTYSDGEETGSEENSPSENDQTLVADETIDDESV